MCGFAPSARGARDGGRSRGVRRGDARGAVARGGQGDRERGRLDELGVASAPSHQTVPPPASGRYRPASSLIRVDLPEPFSPTRAMTLPIRAVRDTSRRVGRGRSPALPGQVKVTLSKRIPRRRSGRGSPVAGVARAAAFAHRRS
ncbi:hypothetical protein GCM10010371_52970 [Streptomyces subrutilus]|uniref:Uncharacterized protein n=1 Tax=Streptomyces subrutilus TaxID=36818 RepID=A0A918R7D7_9ACTN|nr:hypothetical protein GCM10010371_52970 [Streptomyces subrutilus]